MTPRAYPHGPGSKERGGTSEAAATTISGRAVGLRAAVIGALFRKGPMTTDETAAELGESVLSIRPRFTELAALGRIEKTAERRTNASGHNAIVWRLTGEQVPAIEPSGRGFGVFVEIGRRIKEAAA